jgi:hypothetical protein
MPYDQGMDLVQTPDYAAMEYRMFRLPLPGMEGNVLSRGISEKQMV